MAVKDAYPQGKRTWILLHEKGGKFHEVPCHHKAEEYLDAYLNAAGIREQPKTPLFRSTRGRTWPEPAVTLAKPLSGDAILRAVEEALRRARAKNVSAHA